jgi:KUP system potassium uptake protein
MRSASANDGKPDVFTLAVAAIGVVFGDIGTSPLYTMKEAFGGSHPVAANYDNVLGVLSLVFWALVIVVTLKYVVFMMRADNRGEGGISGLLALVLRATASGTGGRWLLMTLGLFGAALFYGDGIITPAISVLSAVEGLEVATPALQPFVIPITIVILIGLFLFQQKGTGMVGALFGPITAVWFAVLALLGIINIIEYPVCSSRFRPSTQSGSLPRMPGAASWCSAPWYWRSPAPKRCMRTWAISARTDPSCLGCLRHAGAVAQLLRSGRLILHNPAALAHPFFRMAPRALFPMVILAPWQQ